MTRGDTLSRIDRTLDAVMRWGAWLVLPLVALLCLQWPLRDVVQAYSREANDLGQCIFALYIAFALTAATRARAHLHADLVSHRFSARTRARIERIGIAVAVLPWTVFVLYTGTPIAWRALVSLEAFPDSFNPGYFVVKLAMWLLALLLLLQCVLDIARGERSRGS
jgi:TRAP-type mannitol/chloroaromatic compound transport system permease small subunit